MACELLDHDEVYTLDVGTYNVQNISVNLVAIIQFKRYSINVTVPLPVNYPKTAISNSQIIKKEGLFHATFTVISAENSSWIELVNIAQNTFKLRATSAIALNAYYVIPKQRNIEATGDETFLLTGFGKKVLCLSMFYIMNRFAFQPFTTIIVLEASGGAISTPEDIARFNSYLSLGKQRLLELYRQYYPQLYNNNYDEVAVTTNRGLANLLVSLENNLKLVLYYKDYLGFVQLSTHSLETLMGTTLDVILNYCQQ